MTKEQIVDEAVKRITELYFEKGKSMREAISVGIEYMETLEKEMLNEKIRL